MAFQNSSRHSQRDLRIDTLRGLMLVSMTINHSLWITFDGLSWLQNYVYQPFGFVTAAEGFVFLSGLVTGIVYTRLSWQVNTSALKKVASRRVQLIYLTHVLLFTGMLMGSLFNLELSNAFFRNSPEFIDYYSALGLGVLLLYQPTYLDILPMYCLFVAITPFVINQIKHRRGVYILLLSFTMWLAAQSSLLESFVYKLRILFPIHLGFFNILAWQLLFIIGIILGFQRFSRNESLLPHRFRATILVVCVSFAMLFFVLRHQIVNLDIIPHIELLTDKPRLGPIRLLNFLIIAHLISRLCVRFEKILSVRWLAFLGQHSLQVFAFHIFALYALSVLTMQISSLDVTLQFVIIGAVVLTLSLPAYFHLNYKEWKVQQKRRQSEFLKRRDTKNCSSMNSRSQTPISKVYI